MSRCGTKKKWSSPSGRDRPTGPLIAPPGNPPPAFLECPLYQKVVIEIGEQALIVQNPERCAPAVAAVETHESTVVVSRWFRCLSAMA